MKYALLAATCALPAFAGTAASAETRITYISPSIILMGEPAPAATDPAPTVKDSEPMPRVITGATDADEAATEAAEDAAAAAQDAAKAADEAAAARNEAEAAAGVSTDDEAAAIEEPNETVRSVVPPPETPDLLRGPIIPAPPANTVGRMDN